MNCCYAGGDGKDKRRGKKGPKSSPASGAGKGAATGKAAHVHGKSGVGLGAGLNGLLEEEKELDLSVFDYDIKEDLMDIRSISLTASPLSSMASSSLSPAASGLYSHTPSTRTVGAGIGAGTGTGAGGSAGSLGDKTGVGMDILQMTHDDLWHIHLPAEIKRYYGQAALLENTRIKGFGRHTTPGRC